MPTTDDCSTDFPLRRILFVCGSLEPGRSGVGDYALALAKALKTQCIDSAILALNDRYLTQEESSVDEGIQIRRLPAHLTPKDWIVHLKNCLEEFQPDWISLQYVGYAYDSQGLARSITQVLQAVRRKHQIHIMFHELWEGFGARESLKTRVRGWLQRHFVHQMLRSLKPTICHTQNGFYLERLAELKHPAEYLPLFGNITPLPPQPQRAQTLFEKAGLPLANEKRESFLLFGFFGSIYSNWPMQTCFESLREVQEKTGRKVVCISLGNLGKTRDSWELMKAQYGANFGFCEVGFLGAEDMSFCLSELDYGIATTPFEGLGKSGSFVAMLEHGKAVFAGEGLLCAPLSNEARREPNSFPFSQLPATVLADTKSLQKGSRLNETTALLVRALSLN
jgi:hypothetical protein